MLSTSVTQDHGLEAAKFWKHAYERAEREKAQLQDYIQRLESQRLEISHELSPGPKKRKADSDVPIKANTQSKRRELDRDPTLVDLDTETAANSEGREDGRSLLRHIFQLKCLLRSDNPALDQLCLRTGSICQAIEGTFNRSSREKGISAKSRSSVRLADLSSLFVASYPLILQAIDHATRHEASDNELTIANGSIVQLFQAALGQLHRHALDQVTRWEEEQRSRGKKPKPDTKAPKSDAQNVKSNPETESEALVEMLITMLTSIDAIKDSHCELLEGLLCALLDHMGSSLALLVFADPGAPKGDLGIEPPGGLVHVAHVKPKAALTAAEIEGPYLVTVLRSGLRFLQDNQQNMSTFMKEIFSWTEHKDIPDAAVLREKINTRLQGTLLRGVFGDEDTTFDNALRREHPLEDADIEAIRQGVRDPEQDKSTWFIGQMWEQLGWEMLSGRPRGKKPGSA